MIARWRSDIYLTIASIADFQPHVTSGVVPPPANPLVISQPCIRLNDLDEIGKSGRHLSMFEMMGHHAFNKNVDEIYWKEDTVKYCDEFFTTRIGIPRTLINYKELIGTNTEKSILSGVINGTVSEVDTIISRYREHYSPLKTIICGGDSQFLANRLKNSIFAIPELVIYGLNEILDYNEL